MLRALVARLRMWLDLLIGIAGPRGWQTRPCPACGRRVSKRALKCRPCGTWRAVGDPRETSVQGERAAAFSEDADVGRHVEVGAQPDPREEVGIGLLGLRSAEQELPEVLRPLTVLPTERQPHRPVRRQRDEL